jgi:hypothetical protein
MHARRKVFDAVRLNPEDRLAVHTVYRRSGLTIRVALGKRLKLA